jgi:NTP pyrophosphatase (non-canonical NTP hydrolase)
MTPFAQQPLHRKGVTKLIEELHELGQVLAKKAAFMDTDDHPDGKGSLKLRLEDEAGDVLAAIAYLNDNFPLSPIFSINIAEKSETIYNNIANNFFQDDPKGIYMLLFSCSKLQISLCFAPFGIKKLSRKILASELKQLESSIAEFLAFFYYFSNSSLNQPRINSRKNEKLVLFCPWNKPEKQLEAIADV